MSAKRYILVFCLALSSLMLCAQGYYNSTNSGVRHYLDFGISGGVLVPVTKNDGVTNKIGADGQFAVSYELDKKFFFFNIGAGVQYNLVNRQIDHFVDATSAQDPNYNAMTYHYVFNNWKESQHEMMLIVPVQFGFYMTRNLYLAVGAKLQMPFYGSYNTQTHLYTEGVYNNLISYVSQNVPSFGYYPDDVYTDKGNLSYNIGNTFRVAPGLEFGGKFHIKKRLSCKVALYADYSIPVGKPTVSYDLVDYSAVASAPGTRTMDNLKENIHLYPTTLSRYNTSVVDYAGKDVLAKATQNLSVGVRFVLHVNVSTAPRICRCVTDN